MTQRNDTLREEFRGTVGDVARELGVTVRTLHHYDEVGLLHPSDRGTNGYRYYTADDLLRLRTIVVWRRLEIPLDEISQMLRDDADHLAHLQRQRDAVMDRLDELSQLVRAIDNALEAQMNDTPASTEDMKEIFGADFDDGYAAEAQQKWGDSPEWKQSHERTKNYSRAQWEQIKTESDAVEACLLAAFRDEASPESERGVSAAEAHRRHMETWFYDCDSAMFRNLAHLYVQDERFTAHYDESHGAPGFADWVSQAMLARAEQMDASGS